MSVPALVPDAEAYLARAIGQYSSPVAATARASLEKLRARFPGARLLVYERRPALPIGLAPAAGGGAVMSLVLYPRWVRFFFLEGVAIEDPEGRLDGQGRQVRSLRVDAEAALFDDPYVIRLMAQAVRLAGVNLKVGRGEVVLKSRIGATSGKSQRSRPRSPNKRLQPTAARAIVSRRG